MLSNIDAEKKCVHLFPFTCNTAIYRETFHLLGYAPNAHNSQMWSTLKPGPRTPSGSPKWVIGV